MDIRKVWTQIRARTKQWEWGIVLAIAGIVIAILVVFIQPFITKELLMQAFAYATVSWIGVCLALMILGLMIVAIRQSRKIASLSKRLSVEEVSNFGRWPIKEVVYGHIAYRPLLYYDQYEEPLGVGITLLKKIFWNHKIVGSGERALWSNLVENLTSNQYDIVATPIFETRERSKQIAFCSPIFYSDIGMYVKRASESDQKINIKIRKGSALALGNIPSNSQSFEDAIAIFSDMKLKITAIEGEISGKMSLKYLGLKREDIKWLKPETASVRLLIEAVNGENKMECDVVFAEVFQAEQTIPVKRGEVINILRPKEVLYPVSFAVRKQDYTLKHYINLKLLEIEETTPNGILGIIWDELKTQKEYAHYTFDDIRRYFVREWNGHPGISSGRNQSKPHETPNTGGLHGKDEGDAIGIKSSDDGNGNKSDLSRNSAEVFFPKAS
jgi:ABC-type amino acid transport substrate-binding protein